jgi:tRNA modification GTPase
MERSRELISRADLLIYVVDGAAGFSGEDRAFIETYGSVPGGPEPGPGGKAPLIVVWNKADMAPAVPGTELSGGKMPALSAKTGQGLPELIAALKTALAGITGGGREMVSPETPGLGTVRQKDLINGAEAAVKEALSLSAQGEALDLIAPRLRDAVNALGEITGEVSTPEILETMFSRFCVGK